MDTTKECSMSLHRLSTRTETQNPRERERERSGWALE